MLKKNKTSNIKKIIFSFGCLLLAFSIGFSFIQNHPLEHTLPTITYILVEKHQRKMTIFHDNLAIKSYQIALGAQPIGPKHQEGDNKTPEGFYKIISKNNKSKFYLSLKISYPNKNDTQYALAKKMACGGDLMIHGVGKGFSWLGKMHAFFDWTRGCIAVSNAEIDEIYHSTPVGTPIEIRP